MRHLHAVMGNSGWRLVEWSLENFEHSLFSWVELLPPFDSCYVQSRLAHRFGERKIQTEGPQKYYPSATWAGLLHISTELNDQQEGCLCLAYVCCVTKLRWNLACNPRGLTNPVMNWDSLIGDVSTQFPDCSVPRRYFLSWKWGNVMRPTQKWQITL